MIKWDNKYSVNVSGIDDDHKKFIGILNKAIHVQKCKNIEPIDISELLIEMTAYARKHFRTEETYMIDCKYSDYSSHKDEHNSFAQRIPDYWQELADNNFGVIDTILEQLESFFTDHVQGTDKKYEGCFHENGLK